MISREQLIRNETFWTETIQNKIYNDLASYIKNENISQKEIAKRLGVSKGRVSQILNGKYLNFRIDTLVKICLSIGKVPKFNFEDLENFLIKDEKSHYFSTVYSQEYIELTSLNSSRLFSTKPQKGRVINFSEAIKKESLSEQDQLDFSNAI